MLRHKKDQRGEPGPLTSRAVDDQNQFLKGKREELIAQRGAREAAAMYRREVVAKTSAALQPQGSSRTRVQKARSDAQLEVVRYESYARKEKQKAVGAQARAERKAAHRLSVGNTARCHTVSGGRNERALCGGLKRSFSAGGTDWSAEVDKHAKLSRFLIDRGAPKREVRQTKEMAQLQKYAFDEKYLFRQDALDEDIQQITQQLR